MKHNLEKYLNTLMLTKEVNITRLNIDEIIKLVAKARKLGYILDYKHDLSEKLYLVIKGKQGEQ